MSIYYGMKFSHGIKSWTTMKYEVENGVKILMALCPKADYILARLSRNIKLYKLQ